ncbi:MAG: hypothetical protein DHS20C01_35870 [marine bacterium B5-7]|nr:MAG: hypothetical protein DHS20C01_35870 [marine bacterium B5-7]
MQYKASARIIALFLVTITFLAGCGTLTGIPSHGGGKRFAIEQELVAGTARAAAKDFDVSAIVGRRAAVYLTSIGDIGTGNLLGGRLSLSALLRGEAINSPVVEEQADFSLIDTRAMSTSNTTTRTGSGSQSSGSSVTSTSSADNASTSAGGGSSSTEATGNSTTSSDSTSSTSTSSQSDSSSRTDTTAQVVSPEATRRRTRTNDEGFSTEVGIGYSGIGGYSSSQVVVARDTQFLSAIIQTYLVLSGVIVVPPEFAEVDIYITVDVFGTIRSRKDWLVVNAEMLKAKTAMELAAIDRQTGEVIIPPQVSSYEAEYRENFTFWMGPSKTAKSIKRSDGLLSDYTTLTNTSN